MSDGVEKCPKCGGTVARGTATTSNGCPMDGVACQSCDWYRLVIGQPSTPLTDEVLADLLAEMEDSQRAGPPCEVNPATVSALVREVLRLRSDNAAMRRDAAALSREIRASLVVAENNALRKNNERLLATNKRLTELLKEARSANATAQAMAAHWRIQALGTDTVDE